MILVWRFQKSLIFSVHTSLRFLYTLSLWNLNFYLKLNRDYFLRLILQFGLRVFVCVYMCSYIQMHAYIWVQIHVHICTWRPEVYLRWCFSGAVHLFLRQGLSLDLVLNGQARIDGQWVSGIKMSFLTSKPPQCVFVCMCDIQAYMQGTVMGDLSRLDSL